MKINREFIQKYRSRNGGWSRAQLDCLGVKWPPRHGWMKKVVARDHDEQKLEEFARLANAHLTPDQYADPKPDVPVRYQIGTFEYRKQQALEKFKANHR